MARKRLSLPFDGSRARHERERQGLTLAALAEKCEAAGQRIAITTLHRWETGAFVPKAPRLKTLANALNISVDDLLTPEHEITRESA